MKTRIIILIITFTCGSLSAQQSSVSDILSRIEKNNTTLKALRENAEAQKLSNKTGIYLTGPEAEIGYLWGNPSAIGNRTDISVKQNFDIGTISGLKNKLASDQNILVDLQYESERIDILLQAKQLLIELAYYNALQQENTSRLKQAGTIALSAKTRLDKGDTNVLEYNKSQLHLSAVRADNEKADLERAAVMTKLRGLNGGLDIVADNTQYEQAALPPDFETWFNMLLTKHPALLYAHREVELRKKQIALNKVAGLPSLSAGFMSEKVLGQQYQGVTVGISVPLWQNKNRIKQAKAAARAAEARGEDDKIRIYNHYLLLYNKAAGLQVRASNLRKSLETLSNTALLKKALDAGEISMLEYILELGLYYDNITVTLQAERDAQLAMAELRAVDY
jgi:outer membrane protein TolC